MDNVVLLDALHERMQMMTEWKWKEIKIGGSAVEMVEDFWERLHNRYTALSAL